MRQEKNARSLGFQWTPYLFIDFFSVLTKRYMARIVAPDWTLPVAALSSDEHSASHLLRTVHNNSPLPSAITCVNLLDINRIHLQG